MGQIKLAWSLAFVAVLGVLLAAFREPSELWLEVARTLTLGMLATSVLGAVLLGRRAPGWAGFAVFGGGYFLLTLGADFRPEEAPKLITMRGIEWADRLLVSHVPTPPPPEPVEPPTYVRAPSGDWVRNEPAISNYERDVALHRRKFARSYARYQAALIYASGLPPARLAIGHMIGAALAGVLGVLVANLLARSRGVGRRARRAAGPTERKDG